MIKKRFIAGMLLASMMVIAGGCGNKEEAPTPPEETPVETPEETPVETPEETPEEMPEETPEETAPENQVFDGKIWEVMESKSETELEETEDIYFVSANNEEEDALIVVNKLYFVEEGLFVELRIRNLKDKPLTNLNLDEFTLIENLDYDEETESGTEMLLLDKMDVGSFKDVSIEVGEEALVTFIAPYDQLKNEVYNLNRITYNWGIEYDYGNVFTLVEAEDASESETPEVEAPEETPEG